jgi:hypothetical protein
MLTVNWDGKFPKAQTYYTGANCTGTPLLNSGNGSTPDGEPLFGKLVVYLGTPNTLAIPSNVVNGSAVEEALLVATIDNPTCMASAGTSSGWKLAATTAATVGLPAGTVSQLTAPLSLS